MTRSSKRTASANGTTGSKWITPKRRLAIYLRDRFTCLYCLIDLHDARPFDVTLDHLLTRADAGPHPHRSSNLVTACRSCNSARRDLPLSAFCGPATRLTIRRNTRRSMRRYLALAAAIIAGRVGASRQASTVNISPVNQ